ncbi:MAG: hypothetical protein LUH00_02530, partial [Lachnospiraceae bacterium]|nr:hypothetical protein [Lachnospiraceae bacterium]
KSKPAGKCTVGTETDPSRIAGTAGAAQKKASESEKTPTAKKKTSARKKTAAKKVTSATIPAVSPEVAEQMKLTTNQVCHLTEELPVHLL